MNRAAKVIANQPSRRLLNHLHTGLEHQAPVPYNFRGATRAFSGQGSRRLAPFQPLAFQRARQLATKTSMSKRPAAQSQRVDAPLTRFATFLVLSVTDNPNSLQTVRSTLGGLNDLIKNTAFRDNGTVFTCTAGIGSNIWDNLMNLPRPAELHPFPEIKGSAHTAISTPGDLFLHIRSDRRDLCFEFERQLLTILGDSVTVRDETSGFRYFDNRDLLGFVDGTANPVSPAISDSVLVTADQDAAAVAGSYVVVQKYVHDLPGWTKLPAEKQEAIMGRTKLENMELDDAESGQKSHKTLATIEDDSGVQHEIVRDNMPFGSPGSAEFGTYFIGYSRRLWVIEKMLERMFIGEPEGLHDRLLDFSRPLTGTTFFAPSASMLDSLGD